MEKKVVATWKGAKKLTKKYCSKYGSIFHHNTQKVFGMENTITNNVTINLWNMGLERLAPITYNFSCLPSRGYVSKKGAVK